ncbi:MAG: DUF1269 domain-containing protein [Dehalococcoidia bacterium]
MADNTQLVLAYFDSEAAADQAADAVKSWDKARDDIKLGNIGVLVKGDDGKVKEQKLGPRDTGKGVGIGLALGVLAAIPTGGLSLLGGAILGGGAGAAIGSFFKKGLSKDEVERIGAELDAGHAAVGVMADPGEEADGVMAKLTELGGKAEAIEVSTDALPQAAAAVAGAAAAAESTPPATATATEPAPPAGP